MRQIPMARWASYMAVIALVLSGCGDTAVQPSPDPTRVSQATGTAVVTQTSTAAPAAAATPGPTFEVVPSPTAEGGATSPRPQTFEELVNPQGEAWQRLRRRPLNLPQLRAGDACPTTADKEIAIELEPALGDGPVYPVGFGTGGKVYLGDFDASDWPQQDGHTPLQVDWVAREGYPGQALVRGRQLDRRGSIRFGLLPGDDRATELLLPKWGAYTRWAFDQYANGTVTTLSGWQVWDSQLLVRDPGCYALQVDGENFSRILVFEVVEAASKHEAPPEGPGRPLAPGWRIPYAAWTDEPLDEYDLSQDLYLVNADGSGRTLVFDSSEYAGEYGTMKPMLSPDGKRVAYSHAIAGAGGVTWDVFVADAGGGKATNLTKHDEWEYPLAWSPDSKQIAFSRSPATHVVAADGGEPVKIPNSEGAAYDFAWSPDGQHVAFRRDTAMHLMNLDGTNLRQLTRHGNSPAWSQDGERIVFVYADDVYVINADGTRLKRLTNDPAFDGLPVWSPDGEHIAFLTQRGHKSSSSLMDLYVMEADGSHERLLMKAIIPSKMQ